METTVRVCMRRLAAVDAWFGPDNDGSPRMLRRIARHAHIRVDGSTAMAFEENPGSPAMVAKLRQPMEVLDVGPDRALMLMVGPCSALTAAVQHVELGQRGAHGLLEVQAPAVTDGDGSKVRERPRPQSCAQLCCALVDRFRGHRLSSSGCHALFDSDRFPTRHFSGRPARRCCLPSPATKPA